MKLLNKPLSIIFCTYNKRGALKRSLDNTMGQVDLEGGDQVIVADGGSTDGVENMLRKHFMPEVELVTVKKHTPWNLNAVRNLGVFHARNDRCVIFDADVIPQPECINELRERAAQGQFFGGIIIYETPPEILAKFAKKHKGEALPDQTLVGNYPVEDIVKMLEEGRTDKTGSMGGIMCFSKTDWQRVGGFDKAYDGAWGFCETDFILKLHFSGVKVDTVKPQRTSDPRFSGIGFKGVFGLHQRHKERKRWKLESMERNRRILVSRLPMYKEGIIDIEHVATNA